MDGAKVLKQEIRFKFFCNGVHRFVIRNPAFFILTLSNIVAALKSGKNASSNKRKNNSCCSIPYTLSKNKTTLCLLAGIKPDGISLFGRSSPAAGFWRVNRKLSTPWRSSNGTKDRKIARARKESFFPCSRSKKTQNWLMQK